jgi:hypothetical protein
LLGMCCCSCLLRLACLFTVPWGISPPPLLWSGHPTLFAVCLFCCYCLFSFFFLFSLSGGQSVQGAMLIWPRVFCGSTTCCLAHLVVHIFPSSLGTGAWQHQEPSWFLHLTWSGVAMHGLGVWRSQILPLLGGFSCKVYLQHLSKILL